MPEGLSDALMTAMTEERLGSNLSAFNFWAAIGFIWCSCFFALDFNSLSATSGWRGTTETRGSRRSTRALPRS